jgi:hypothetical protein
LLKRKTKSKKQKLIRSPATNLQTHIQYLASDKLEGRRAGTPGELLATQYISDVFGKYKLEPKGDNGYVQEFEINQGKQFTTPANTFTVNGEKLDIKNDFYPLAFSSNGSATGSVSPLLREEHEIWFWNVADLLEDNASNPHFDILGAVKQEAQNDAGKGAKALIVYNTSSTADNILFEKQDTSQPVSIPVVYLTKDGAQKYFGDPTNIYDVSVGVDLKVDNRKGSQCDRIYQFQCAQYGSAWRPFRSFGLWGRWK